MSDGCKLCSNTWVLIGFQLQTFHYIVRGEYFYFICDEKGFFCKNENTINSLMVKLTVNK